MRRSGPPERRTPLARGGRINPVSARRRKRDAIYAVARRRVFDDQDGMCAVETGGLLCGNQMTDVHHIAGRGGPDPHRRTNLIGLCRYHHDLVHANPAWSYQMGLMKSRNGGAA